MMKANVSEKLNDDDSVVSSDMTERGAEWHYNTCNQYYWRQHSYISSWVRNCLRQFSLSPCKPDFHEWCQLMSSYHATMASYMQWNYLSAVATVPQQIGCGCHCAECRIQNVTHLRLPTSVPSSSFYKKCGRGRRRRKRRTRARNLSSAGDIELHIANIDTNHGGLDVALGDGSDNIEFEFEITDDLVKFFAETARHRKERDLMKVAQSEANSNNTTNVDLCSETGLRIRPTVLPPNEQLGARRLSEMRELYGAGAAMIHGMETAMQLSFDRNTDRYKPRPWPALPLNIQFD